jgi:sulfur relay (sulfurtransferase) DsrC/TusE family protein
MPKVNKDQITTIRLTEDQIKFLEEVRLKYKQESLASTIRMIINDFAQQEKIRK